MTARLGLTRTIDWPAGRTAPRPLRRLSCVRPNYTKYVGTHNTYNMHIYTLSFIINLLKIFVGYYSCELNCVAPRDRELHMSFAQSAKHGHAHIHTRTGHNTTTHAWMCFERERVLCVVCCGADAGCRSIAAPVFAVFGFRCHKLQLYISTLLFCNCPQVVVSLSAQKPRHSVATHIGRGECLALKRLKREPRKNL